MNQFKTKNGSTVTLLSPSEKGQKYADELRMGIKYTNDGRYKADKHGHVPSLTKEERSYRAGYLAAREDIGKAYAHVVGKKSKKKNKSNKK